MCVRVTSGKLPGFSFLLDIGELKSTQLKPGPSSRCCLRRRFESWKAYMGDFPLSSGFYPTSQGGLRHSLIGKGLLFEWDPACQNAFDSIKAYLTPVLMSPKKGKPLLLYITALDGSLGTLLAQRNEQGKEKALYYLSPSWSSSTLQ